MKGDSAGKKRLYSNQISNIPLNPFIKELSQTTIQLNNKNSYCVCPSKLNGLLSRDEV